ncbi:TPA: hypothetical protein HA238_00200 [Candidatus Micrarchaeota archaeon]|nr:hypothetical protein [Candidatus Micrarchaeota archaeon]
MKQKTRSTIAGLCFVSGMFGSIGTTVALSNMDITGVKSSRAEVLVQSFAKKVPLFESARISEAERILTKRKLALGGLLLIAFVGSIAAGTTAAYFVDRKKGKGEDVGEPEAHAQV